MEATYPMYYYYLSNMMYPAFTNMAFAGHTFENTCSISTQIDLNENHNWLGFYCAKNENSNQINHDFKPITIKTPNESDELQNSAESISKIQKRKYQKKNNLDKNEYVPNQKIDEKKSNAAYLNEYRNVLPNTIHQILSYIQRKNKSKGIIQKLIKRQVTQRKMYKLEDLSSTDCSIDEVNAARFYAYQNHLKNKLPNYVTLQTFRFLCTNQNIDYDSDIFSAEEQRIYNKICRTAILYYIKYEVVCVLMWSKRMQKDKKWEHLKVNRKIQNYIENGFNQESI